VIGGNELQPAQNLDLLFVVFMNIGGLLWMTWIAGEISVLIY
jgi:CRP-like cAMP-binding protein